MTGCRALAVYALPLWDAPEVWPRQRQAQSTDSGADVAAVSPQFSARVRCFLAGAWEQVSSWAGNIQKTLLSGRSFGSLIDYDGARIARDRSADHGSHCQ